MNHIVIHSPNPTLALMNRVAELCNNQAQHFDSYYALSCRREIDKKSLFDLSVEHKVDINSFPKSFDPHSIAMFITDMDSTFIAIECVDEIADFAGKKTEVSEITEAAMQGEVDFDVSLTRRVALLEGLSVDVLQEVYSRRLELSPGAEQLIEGLKKQNIKTALVSGGFTFFTDRLRDRLGFDFALSNVLGASDNRLTGKVQGEIVNADRKARFLKDICNQSNISTKQAIAAGDGANDLKMMNLSGLSVAFRAKQRVMWQADVKINYSGLDSILHILDYAKRVG